MEHEWITDRLPTAADADKDGDVELNTDKVFSEYVSWDAVPVGISWKRTFIWEESNMLSQYDPVNHPSHYTDGRRFETIDVLEDAVARAPDPVSGALQWQALKYMNRMWDKGNALQDASKAAWYLSRLIERLGAAPQDGEQA